MRKNVDIVLSDDDDDDGNEEDDEEPEAEDSGSDEDDYKGDEEEDENGVPLKKFRRIKKFKKNIDGDAPQDGMAEGNDKISNGANGANGFDEENIA